MAVDLQNSQGQQFGPSGANHAQGLVPDPGSSAGTTRSLFEDGTWKAVTAASVLPAPTRAGDIIYWNGTAWVTLAGNNAGTQFLQETSAGVPSWATIATASGTLVSIVTYSSTQTITIPATATKASVRQWGATGGSGGATASGASGGTGAGGYLEKYLTGLTPGNTLAYTQGAAGTAGTSAPGNGGNGGTTTLASGTQAISTLTCNGSNGSAGANGTSGFGTNGATATGGDINVTGQTGTNGAAFGAGSLNPGGNNFFSIGADGVNANSAGNAGNPGGLTISWFT